MGKRLPKNLPFPEGFTYVSDFLSEEEEKKLLTDISKIELHPFMFQGFEAKRKVASFGYDYSFDKRTLSEGMKMPDLFQPLIIKVANYLSLSPNVFAELLVTNYPAGSVINWHRDAPPFELIAGISLLSDCTFRLRPHDKTKQTRSAIISFPVKRRSLYILERASRSEWQHSIAPVKEERYSITLRTLRKKS